MYDYVVLLLIGVLAASNLVIARLPAAKEYIAKIAPYQGWIGVVSLVYGIFYLIRVFIRSFGLLTSGGKGVIYFALITGTMAMFILVGFLLGVGVIKTFVKSEKIDQIATKLAPFQGILGVISMGLAVADLIILPW